MTSLAQLRRAVDENDDAASWYQLGVTLGRSDDPDEGVDALRIALDRSPTGLLAAAIGQSLEALGHPDIAEVAYRRAIDVDPTRPDAYGYLGALLLKSGRTEAALKTFTRWADLCPAPADAHYKLATLLLAREDRNEAASHLQIAVTLDGQHLPALRALGSVYERLGNTQGCLKIFGDLHRLSPNDPEVAVRYGSALAGVGRHQEAIEVLETVIRRSAPSWEVHLELGRALRLGGRAEEAVARLMQAQRLSPSSATIHVELGQAWAAQQRPSDAIAHFEQALEIDPRLVDAHLQLGLLLHELGQSDEASQALVRASALAPTDRRIKQALTEVLEAKKAIDGLGGSLTVIALPDLVQFLANSRRSGVLRIKNGNAKAEVHLVRGGLRSVVAPSGAYTDQAKMVEGLVEIIRWGAGAFEFDHGSGDGPDGIDHRFILMDAMRLLDEQT